MLPKREQYKLSRTNAPQKYFTQIKTKTDNFVPKLLNNRSSVETSCINLSTCNKPVKQRENSIHKLPKLGRFQSQTTDIKSRSMTNLKDFPILTDQKKTVYLIEKGEIHEAMKQPKSKSPNRLKFVWRKTKFLPRIYENVSINLSQKKIENALQRMTDYLKLNQSYT